ncbi:imidazole glycerol phosphate synthase subunit HisF [Tenacibaculum sp. S7007]|uniref:imidazole glycerol-phosphate synthase n=1 Tax=Tenacibaculum pelagium TaxID=2759527 RepID=A0A839AP73_9FLAO|nr:AglZ/HisF2 family acetamidino modification protein [Tenacibaculum pelagium]MBA6156297.1 imidazole glycerol phosphate synthase subunit HisF [Tenacibaculum pelagium]
MLRSRIIPCLLVHNKGLVKTVNFKDAKYVGDPINAVKIFNEKEVDELMVLDIDASKEKKAPNFEMIKNLAVECRMPFCYGGGVTTVEQARKIISLGAEKVALSSAALNNLDLCVKIGEVVGAQSVVVVIDVKKRKLFGGYDIYTINGTKKSKWKLKDLIKELDNIGVGEIVINSIDNDGVMKGYDMDLAETIRDLCKMPLTILGGAGSLEDVKKLISKFKVIGAAAGSLFVFKGKYRAVLINYPNREERKPLY